MSDGLTRLFPTAESQLRLVYAAGIALNVIALTIAAMAGEWLFATTFGIVIAYLCIRYWMIGSS